MAKLTDPEIIQALKDGETIKRKSVTHLEYCRSLMCLYCGMDTYLQDPSGDFFQVAVQDLLATDWEIVQNEA